jgi:hypothetical protein
MLLMLKACLEAVPQTLPPFPHCHLKVALATGIIQHTLGKVDVVRAHQTIVLLGKNLMKGLGSPRLWELLFFFAIVLWDPADASTEFGYHSPNDWKPGKWLCKNGGWANWGHEFLAMSKGKKN